MLLFAPLSFFASPHFWKVIVWLLAALCAIGILSYIVPIFVVAWLLPDQNLKNKYNAKWALVTGASSGLGRCLADRLAAQGLNVVLAALPDNLLEETYHDLKIKYPHLEFRKVPIDFGEYTANYMEALERATNDITIQILFNNVGYCIMGAFTKTPIDQILRNIECNAISHVKVTHHFMKKMVDKKVKGAIVFTGSTVTTN